MLACEDKLDHSTYLGVAQSVVSPSECKICLRISLTGRLLSHDLHFTRPTKTDLHSNSDNRANRARECGNDRCQKGQLLMTLRTSLGDLKNLSLLF